MNLPKTLITKHFAINHLLTHVRKKSENSSSAEYCMNLVKNHDYENFISTILLSKVPRAVAFAVRSFNVEVAKVAEQVTQRDIGLMRMKFWEEALEKCYKGDAANVPQHPVIQEVFKITNQTKMSKRHFTNLISSRKDNFNVNGFNTLDDMEKYVDKSVSSVYYLILEGSNIRNVNADHAASHLGKAQGIVQQLRNILHTQRLKFVSIPQDILLKNNLSHEALLRGQSRKQISDCVYEISSRAHQHLTLARKLSSEIPSDTRAIFLPAVNIENYLQRLQHVDYDVFHPNMQKRSWNLLAKLWWTNYRNKY